MRTERCIRCPKEDTDACDDCKLVQEDFTKALTEKLAREEQRIKEGKDIDGK